MQTNNWSLLNDFIGETVKCEICIDKQTFIKIQNLPNRLDTIHNSLALFDKELIIREKLPELFADVHQFKIESLYKSGKIFKDKNEFEIHIPRRDGTQIDLHFNNKNKLISIYQTP